VVLATRFEMRPHLLEPDTATARAGGEPIRSTGAPDAAK